MTAVASPTQLERAYEEAVSAAVEQWFRDACIRPVHMWAYYLPHGKRFRIAVDPPGEEWRLVSSEHISPAWERGRVRAFLWSRGRRVEFYAIGE